MELRQLDTDTLARHYEEHVGKGFYDDLVAFMSRGPVVAMVVEGPDEQTFSVMRALINKKRVEDAQPGSIRGDFATTTNENLVHGSDGPETAAYELGLYFREDELISWTHDTDRWTLQ